MDSEFFINLSLGTQIPLESAGQEQELPSDRFLTFRKFHEGKHNNSSSQLFLELNFHIMFFKESHERGGFSEVSIKTYDVSLNL